MGSIVTEKGAHRESPIATGSCLSFWSNVSSRDTGRHLTTETEIAEKYFLCLMVLSFSLPVPLDVGKKSRSWLATLFITFDSPTNSFPPLYLISSPLSLWNIVTWSIVTRRRYCNAKKIFFEKYFFVQQVAPLYQFKLTTQVTRTLSDLQECPVELNVKYTLLLQFLHFISSNFWLPLPTFFLECLKYYLIMFYLKSPTRSKLSLLLMFCYFFYWHCYFSLW